MKVLEIESVSAFYGDTQVLWDLSLSVETGRLVALLGANGAGKTTTLRTICGLLQATHGHLYYSGKDITFLPVHETVNLGITLVPEGRQLFPKMTVEENLIVGSYLKRAKTSRSRNLKWVYELFPRLAERKNQTAVTLHVKSEILQSISETFLAGFLKNNSPIQPEQAVLFTLFSSQVLLVTYPAQGAPQP